MFLVKWNDFEITGTYHWESQFEERTVGERGTSTRKGKKYKEKKNKFNNDWNYKLICNGEAPSSSNAYGDKISTLNQCNVKQNQFILLRKASKL